MSETIQGQPTDFIDLASQMASAYVSNNSVRPSDLPGLIATLHTALRSLTDGTSGSSTGTKADEADQQTAAQIKKSITPDALISFLDGKRYKTLKRHLSGHGLTPDSYRAKFGLPADYPMVTRAYSAARSQLAKEIGLGRPGRSAA